MTRISEGEEARRALAAMQANLHRLTRSVRVMIIDDSLDDSTLLSGEIRDLLPEAQVHFAQNKLEAERLCQVVEYDVIFLDLRFPKESGVDIMRTLQCATKGTPVILVTGLDDDSALVREAVEAGAKVIFTKPITRKELLFVFGSIP